MSTTPSNRRPPATQPTHADALNARRAALTLVVSSTLFAIMAAGTKRLTLRLPGAEVALGRFVVGVVVTGIAFATGMAQIRPRRWGWLTARGLFGGIAVVSYFASIRLVPVGVATLLNQTQPIYTMMFSWMLLGERPRRASVGALILALGGVTVIVGVGLGVGIPHVTFSLRGARGELLGVFSAIASGVAVTSIRAARRDLGDGVPSETAWSVFFSFTLLGAVVSLPAVLPPFGHFVSPTPEEWALMIGVGLVSTAAQVIMSATLRHLTGVQSGVIAQLTVPITVVLGLAFLGEHLTAGFLVGATLTVAGVLLAIATAAPRGPGANPTPVGPAL